MPPGRAAAGKGRRTTSPPVIRETNHRNSGDEGAKFGETGYAFIGSFLI